MSANCEKEPSGKGIAGNHRRAAACILRDFTAFREVQELNTRAAVD
jgi:hypothetical protein